MTDGSSDQEALAAAQNLTAVVGKLVAEVKGLRTYGRHNRKFVIFDICLTLLLAVFGVVSVHAANQASRADSAQLALCQSGNVARAQQVALWDYVLHLSGKPPKTQQGRELVAKFEHHLTVVFKPRNCAALGTRKP